MNYFDAWILGLECSKVTEMLGIADNQGIDCIAMRKLAQEKQKEKLEMIDNEKMDI